MIAPAIKYTLPNPLPSRLRDGEKNVSVFTTNAMGRQVVPAAKCGRGSGAIAAGHRNRRAMHRKPPYEIDSGGTPPLQSGDVRECKIEVCASRMI